MSIHSTKSNARYLRALLKQHRCLDIVIAPGSRNAPLVNEFGGDQDYNCISAPDERSAAFIAMGLCIGKKRPAAVLCSSGSATVNFYPAVVEAFYQNLPLVVISADRPEQWVDQGVGQTIRQENIFQSHIVKAINLNKEPEDSLTRNYNQRLINEALIASSAGPAHINVAFDEPLYDSIEVLDEKVRFIEKLKVTSEIDHSSIQKISEKWNIAKKVMVLAGQMDKQNDLSKVLDDLNEMSPFLVLSETVSNLNSRFNIRSIDRLINTISNQEKENLVPDLLITIGRDVVSKMVKKLLNHSSVELWHVSSSGEVKDTFLNLTTTIPLNPIDFFSKIKPFVKAKDASFRDLWMEKDREKSKLHHQFWIESSFSDFKVLGRIYEQLPTDGILHSANSSSIRYAQLFDHPESVEHFSNRGTSGIDGCTSTAIGHALSTSKMVTLVSGDMAFLYDSNGFWCNPLPKNLRVIVINNEGGNIFRIIKGPRHDSTFETYQETTHTLKAKGVASTFNIPYISAANFEELNEALPNFFKESEGPKILEVFTPRMESPEILKEYFQYLKENS